MNGGMCEVKWLKSCLPKRDNRLGILNLESFARALWLRWIQQEWTTPKMAWVGPKHHEMKLIVTTTELVITNGNFTTGLIKTSGDAFNRAFV